MHKRIPYILPLLVLLSALACKKPANLNSLVIGEGFPVASSVSFYDTVSPSVVKALDLKHDVTGIKISYIDGRQVSYFEYEAAGAALINALSSLPFSIHSKISDSGCHTIPATELDVIKKSISSTEVEQGEFFWGVDVAEFEVYECIKAPVRHTVLVSKDSRRILHRVEMLG